MTITANSTGNLMAITWDVSCAGIGGEYNEDCGTITINGGTITAKGGGTGTNGAAGIGGGLYGRGGTITINGGTVFATGGYYAAGIGGGRFHRGGTTTITGGIVIANGGNNAAGIGGGYGGSGGTITISGGTVTATGGQSDGAGIGGGCGATGGTITISGGTVTATGGKSAAGIGGSGSGGTTTIDGGTVTAIGGEGAAGIGGGSGRDGGTTIITGGTVTATGGIEGDGIGSGRRGNSGGTTTITGGTVTATGGTSNKSYNCGNGIGGAVSVSGGKTLAISEYSAFVFKPTIITSEEWPGKVWYGDEKSDVDPVLPGIHPNDAVKEYYTNYYVLIAPATYTVTVNSDGNGTVITDPKCGEKGTEVTLTATPAEGYRFVRWEVVSGGVTIVDNKFTIGTSDVVVNGIFEKLTYPITWKNYNGDVLKVDPAVPYGDTPSYNGETPTKPADAQYTYTFTGWSPAITPVTGEAEYTAQFTNGTNTYPITWKNYNGDVLKVDPAVSYGDTPSYNGETPTKPADAQYTYTFTGWSPAVTPVTGEAEYTAQFTNGTNTYPITWKNYNGDVLKVDPAVPYGDTPAYNGETPVKPADAQYTYTFTGWSPAISPVTKEADYIAQFTATLNTYVITWKNYDGTVLEKDEAVGYGIIPIYNGATPTRPADDKYTYTFKGWSPAVTAASADCEYVAVYEATVPQIPQTGDS
ncbi:MAG: hypothetical protein IKW00_08220, partial [Clostridia bacterium]|nr:hypothetical protein [Clostridia bacterium]